MKYLAVIGILAAVTAVAVSEYCDGHDISTCTLTSCGNGTKVCTHDVCSCEKPTVQGSACVDRVDCDGGSRCLTSEHREDHHHHVSPHDMDGEFHCVDKLCRCLKPLDD